MAHKQVLFRSAAREKILRGATQLAEAIRITLGPKSKSVLIQRKWGHFPFFRRPDAGTPGAASTFPYSRRARAGEKSGHRPRTWRRP